MPEYLRALVFAWPLAAISLAIFRRDLEPWMPAGAYLRRRNAFLILLACGFLSPTFWAYAVPATLVLWRAGRRESYEGSSSLAAAFLALMFVVPPAGADIPGFGIVNFIIRLDSVRLTCLLLFVPAVLRVRGVPHGSDGRLADRLFCCFFAMQALLGFVRGDSLTGGLRTAVSVFIDGFLPYFVVSRSIRSRSQITDALAAMAFVGLVLAAFAIFESARHWLLFKPIVQRWEPDLGYGNYLMRSGSLRAIATTGQPIALGYVLAVSLLCLLALRPYVRPFTRTVAPGLLVAGLFATVSRGPWLGAIAGLLLTWGLTNSTRLRLLLATCAVSAVAAFGSGFNLLGGLKGVDPGSVDYRSALLDNAVEVFWRSPWIGSNDFTNQLARLGMVQGEGIVDIVNTYVQIALESGVIGLALFVGGFGALLVGLLKANSASRSRGLLEQRHIDASRVLIATCSATLVTIGTVSSITMIPWLYWTFTALAVGYLFNESTPPPFKLDAAEPRN